MKKQLICFVLAWAMPLAAVWAQESRPVVLGQYEQDYYGGPDEVQEGETDLIITPDPKLTKVIWIENLLQGGKIKAVLHTGDGPGSAQLVYSIPAQQVGSYQIKLGCLHYKKAGELMVSLNNKIDCHGLKNSDYGEVSVGMSGKIQAGGVSVNNRGLKAPGVQISNSKIKVNAKEVMAGVQYKGHKMGMKPKNTDDEDEDN